ncbi:hypothetical protein AVEN_172507-1 [Araneus ventricosus]|uniref:Pre-C2HC domain-containing protein n=1 Tax=Araneus ventricosus TaxID=182803 RepID=A0A4Y2DQD9_ARAVE|nr:hypothetical protein AVEN_172507-1 [Araneus ventricosus]
MCTTDNDNACETVKSDVITDTDNLMETENNDKDVSLTSVNGSDNSVKNNGVGNDHSGPVNIDNCPPNGNTAVKPNVPVNRVINNCVVYDMPGGEITASDADGDIMNVDLPPRRQINEVEKIKCLAKEAGAFLKLHCTTSGDVRKLTDYLDKNQNEYFVIPRKAIKPIKVVIKGLPKDMDMDKIKTDLISKKFRVEKVNQLKKFKTRESLNIFQIHLIPTDNIHEIYKLDTLSYHIISAVPYQNRHNHQCFNCQRWNHGSNGCKLNPRCVVCSDNRPSKECPLKGEKDNVPKC